MKLHRLFLATAALMILALGIALAGDNGTVVVTTQEANGSPFPGIVVQLKNSKNLGVPAPKQTDANGKATFMVPPGQGYSVEVSLATYSTQVSEEFKVEIDKTKTVRFTMQPTIQEKVVVKAEKVVDLEDGGTQKFSMSDNFVEDLPVLGRSYQSVLKLAPGVNDSNGDGNPNVHGARERDFKATVDGISNVDPLTGTFMSNVNPDAIEEIEVVTTGAGAEYGGAVGGFSKIITKQGTNAFDGSVSIYLRSSLLDGGTVNTGTDAEPIQYHDVRPTLNLTGPIVKDKLFFALFHEYQDIGTPVNFVGSGGIVIVRKGTTNLDKVTWQVSPRNKLVFQAQSDPRRVAPLGVTALSSPYSGYAYQQGGPIYQIHWDSQVSSVFNIQSLIGASHTGIDAIPTNSGIRNNCGIDFEYAQGNRNDPFGGPVAQPIDQDQCFEILTSRTSGAFYERYTDDRIRYTARSDASYFVENFLGISHTFKAGFVAQKTSFSANDQYRGFSVFNETKGGFGGLDTVGYAGSGVLARQVNYPTYPGAAINTAQGSNYGIYIEDQFRPDPNLSMRIGLRVEQENMEASGFEHFSPQQEYESYLDGYRSCLAGGARPDTCARANFNNFHKYEAFPVIGNYPFRPLLEDPRVGLQPRVPENFRISNTNLGPRFSVSWDPGTNGKSKFFGTAGRYYGETFLLIPAYEQPADLFNFTYRVIADETTTQCRPDQNGDGTPECVTYPEIDSDANSRVSPASIRQVDRNLATPYQDEYTLGFSTEIFQETSITITAIRRYFRDQLQDIDVNHYGRDRGTVSTYGCALLPNGQKVPVNKTKDGIFDDCGGAIRVVRGAPPFYRPTTVEVPDGIPDLYIYNPFFNQINLIGNFNQSNYEAYQFELTRRLHRNWELEASYVWSQAVGNAEDYNQTLGNDPTTKQKEYGPLSFDQTHFVKLNARTQVPAWNVRLSAVINWQSGLPYSYTNVGTAYDGVTNYGSTSVQYSSNRTTYPTGQRNDQRNASFWLIDLGGRKDFSIGKTSLQVSLDIINVLNNAPLYVRGVVNRNINAVRLTGRQFQIGAKLAF